MFIGLTDSHLPTVLKGWPVFGIHSKKTPFLTNKSKGYYIHVCLLSLSWGFSLTGFTDKTNNNIIFWLTKQFMSSWSSKFEKTQLQGKTKLVSRDLVTLWGRQNMTSLVKLTILCFSLDLSRVGFGSWFDMFSGPCLGFCGTKRTIRRRGYSFLWQAMSYLQHSVATLNANRIQTNHNKCDMQHMQIATQSKPGTSIFQFSESIYLHQSQKRNYANWVVQCLKRNKCGSTQTH